MVHCQEGAGALAWEGCMVEMLCQAQAKDSDHAMSAMNVFEEHIRAYEERGGRYRVDGTVMLARIQQLMPLKIQELIALTCPGECDYATMRRTMPEYLLIFTKGSAPIISNLQVEKPPPKPKVWDWWLEEWPEPSGELAYSY